MGFGSDERQQLNVVLWDDDGNPVGVVLDGSIYRIQTATKLVAGSDIVGKVGIDPAETGGLALEATLSSIDGKDFATETTLLTRATEATLLVADGRLTTIDATLDSIKDTDGIKKITDQLPAGTNILGRIGLRSNAKGASVAADLTSEPVDANTEALHTSPQTLAPDAATETTLLTRATEATLLVADGRLTTIDAVLDSIKDTDGIKKITDPLPAGTNNIGDVDVVSSALPTGAATEATLASIDGKDFATETTLLTRATEATLLVADGRLTTIDAVLDSIKDTDGIKKITDLLPAGTNNIGDVDVVSSALPAGAATETTLLTRATEATLLVADGRLTTIDATLDSIKDTDGIKKITDQLPAGTNEIGLVAQGTKAAAADGWPTVLYDASGNPVSVFLDGAVYRIRSEGLIVGKTKGTGANKEVSVIDDPDTVATKRLQVEMAVKPGSVIGVTAAAPAAVNSIVTFLRNGGSENMLVNGSVTPVSFTFGADATFDIIPTEIRLVLTAATLNWGNFGKGGSILTNGVVIDAEVDDGVPITLYTLTRNEGFMRMQEANTEFNGASDLILGSIHFSGVERLVAGSTDFVRVTINDDLTAVLRSLNYFTATFYGTIES